MTTAAVMAAAALALSAALEAAPADPQVTVGSLMRIQARTPEGEVKGTLVGVDEDALKLATAAWSRSIPVEAIAKAEVRVGRRRRILEGLALGMGAGLLISQAWDVDPDRCGSDGGTYCSRRAATLSGLGVYGVLGAGIGATLKKDRWAVVDADAALAQARTAFGAPAPRVLAEPLGPELEAASCSPIAAADRVRVTAPGIFDGRVVGYVLGSDAETLQVVYSGQTMRVPRDSVTGLERSVRRSRRIPGLKVGAVFGAVAGAVASALVEDEDARHGGPIAHMYAGYMGAFPGALLGGALAPGERWVKEDPRRVCVQRVASSAPERGPVVRAGIAAVPGGVGLRVSVGF